MIDMNPGCMVTVDQIPPGLLDGLPWNDQAAIQAIIGRPVMVVGHSFGHTEVEFIDRDGATHSIWVDTALLKPINGGSIQII